MIPMVKKPDYEGCIGKAWQADLVAVRKAHDVAEADDGTIDVWLLEAPGAHPVWHSYTLVLIHLRPMPDGRPTRFYLEGATHEIWLHAMNPDIDRERFLTDMKPQDIAGELTGGWLEPKNFASQLICESDDAARKLILEMAVKPVCDGVLSPDTDYVRHWHMRFGDNMLKKEYR
jgi:hypothetical protein